MAGKKEILVLGVGNLLLKDEGFGVHVVHRLRDMDLPPEVEVLEGGTAGLDLLEDIEGRKKVIFVDVVKAGRAPGTLYRFGGEDLEPRQHSQASLHDIGLSDLLAAADMFGKSPQEVTVIGIEPKDMETADLELSAEIEAKIPKVIELVLKEIGQ